MLVVVPLSALTDHTLKAPELLSGLITASPRPVPYTSMKVALRLLPPRALRQLLFVFPTYYFCGGKVR